MELDFRNEEDALPQLKMLDATTMNSIVDYCKKRVIDIKTIEVIHFADGDQHLVNKVGWATSIAKHFDAVVHFAHKQVPATTYPNLRAATFADFERRRRDGERVGANDEDA